mmetsp:Transcript_27183/g.34709  ORF Transcript_27183/g.34709 Transcript_27183/m.34709 type:complete len:242 (-) Transcript_27183:12-737(-)
MNRRYMPIQLAMMIGFFAIKILLSLPLTTAFFFSSSSAQHLSSSVRLCMRENGEVIGGWVSQDPDNGSEGVGFLLKQKDMSRRSVFRNLYRLTAASSVGVVSACSCCLPGPANALAKISEPLPEAVATYDLARDKMKDFRFAYGMAVGMERYERDAYPKKLKLFQKLFSSLSDVSEPVVVEVGMGSFPNAQYYKGTSGLDIIGVDPNDSMSLYANNNAALSGLLQRDSLRVVHGVGEALPF